MEKYEFSIFHSFLSFPFSAEFREKFFHFFLRFQRTNTIYVNFMENVCLGLYPNSPPRCHGLSVSSSSSNNLTVLSPQFVVLNRLAFLIELHRLRLPSMEIARKNSEAR